MCDLVIKPQQINRRRLYEFELSYTFKNIVGEGPLAVPTPQKPVPPSVHTKPPKSIDGQPFDIADCNQATLLVLDNTDMVQIDNTHNSRIFIAASSESVFVRDCSGLTLTVACKQLRLRDCKNCNIYLYSKTEPIIETSSVIAFAPFNGAFEGHAEAMARANLQPSYNLWFAVYDFNDEAKSGINWRILKEEEEEPTWCPMGEFKNCCPRIESGSIALPSQMGDGMGGGVGGGVTLPPPQAQAQAQANADNGAMMSFGFETSLHDAAAITGDAFVAQETANPVPPVPVPPQELGSSLTNVPALTSSFTNQTGDDGRKNKKASSVGWNPASIEKGPNEGVSKKATSGGGVGWNPAALSQGITTTAAASTSRELPAKTSISKTSSVGWNPSALTEQTSNDVQVQTPAKAEVEEGQTNGASNESANA